jgi:hypothetical protein
MAESKVIWILKPLKCPDSVDLVHGDSATATGYPLRLAKLAARGAAARKVIKEIKRGASLNKCPEGCTQELGSIKAEEVSYKCKRIWWTLWTNHRCTCTYTATITLKCVPKPKTKAQAEPEVAYLEEVQEAQFSQILIGLVSRFVFPLFFLCAFFFLARTTYYAVLSPVPRIVTNTPAPPATDTPEPNTPEPVATSTSAFAEQIKDVKAASLFVAMLTGSFTHFEGYSEVWAALQILGADPEPVAGAEVTMTMMHPDGSTETQTATTDADGSARLVFTIYVYGTYSLAVDEVSAQGYERTPELDMAREIVVPVGGANVPPVLAMDAIQAFYTGFNQAFTDMNTDYLYSVLHPAVLERYGEEACRSTLDTVIANTIQVEALRLTELGAWNWEMDEVTGLVPNTYTIEIRLTLPDGSTLDQETHLAIRDDGSLGWFTDCGDPLG